MTDELAPSRREAAEAASLLDAHRMDVFRRTDRLFAGLMVFQWAAAIAGAVWLTPSTWAGAESSVHPHVWASVVMVFVCLAVNQLPLPWFWRFAVGSAAALLVYVGLLYALGDQMLRAILSRFVAQFDAVAR